ncbi:helix-turn-helix domain-containing protein [Sanguibacter gelidistatuariae]|nr:helix-turn-helix domain-containing protein [Sanguibacter gelidistatuariae]
MAAPRTETFRTLASPSRVELLHLLQERDRRTLAELVEATGLHPNTVREHLQRLTRGGYVTSIVETRTTRGRPRTLYSAATGADVETNDDVARKVASATERGDLLRRYLESTVPTPTARLPEGALRQIDALDDHLDQSGFNACIDEAALRVDITDCPYQDMVAESHGMVCVVHLGLVRTVLSQAGGPVTARALLPFSGPGCCTLSLECGRRES